MHKKTVENIKLDGKRVLVRVDYNVPIHKDGTPGDLLRIEAGLPTLKYLLSRGCSLVLISHLGRPEGHPNAKFSLLPVVKPLQKLLGRQVKFVPEAIGLQASEAVQSLQPGEVLLLENLRFYEGEEANDRGFAQTLASYGEVFVQDGFAVVHRAHASTEAITKFLPSVSGLLLEHEVTIIRDALEHPKRPLLAIIGGAKISDKIEVIEALLKKADYVAIGGAMANTFLNYEGYPIGNSVYEKGQEEDIENIYTKLSKKIDKKPISEQNRYWKDHFVLPIYGVAVGRDFSERTTRREVANNQVEPGDLILDFGQGSIDKVVEEIGKAGMVIWNGPVGMTELSQFEKGSEAIAEAIVKAKVPCIIGGGDTAAFIDEEGLHDRFYHVSTGGGASLELMAGKKLPGVEALLDK